MRHDLVLDGHGVRLVPLEAEHAAALAAFVDEAVWRGMTTPTPRGPAGMAEQVRTAHATAGRLAFAVLAEGRVVGSTSFYDWTPAQGRAEVGHTFYDPAVWGTRVNPACKHLLLRHAFEVWGAHRVALRADARNTRSVGAITRLGAVPEGVLRGHRVAPDGSRGDTAYFSVLADEWPAVRDGLLVRLGGDGLPGAPDRSGAGPDGDAVLLDRWRREEVSPPGGWDFGHLTGRMVAAEPPWDLTALTRDELRSATAVLDMGTGGGERLLDLARWLPADTSATEGWPPNLPVARAALEPRGIPVAAYDPDAVPAVAMPFPDGRFDLVLNRHESFDPAELVRVLRPGGVLLMQQVGGDDAGEVHDWFGGPVRFPQIRPEPVARALQEAGLVVDRVLQWHGPLDFTDVGALVQYLQMVPWDVPEDFGVDRCAGTLLDLHRRGPALGRPLRLTQSRFLVRAHRPG